MSTWTARRFWTEASAVEVEGGFTVHLDTRPVRTPLKAAMVLPTLALAEAIAGEWQAQVELVKPETMPLTRTANSAIDKVTPQFAAVADMLAAYAETDLLCYRADGPSELIQRQAASWDPVLAWADTTFAAPLLVTTGVAPVIQPASSLSSLRAVVHRLSAYQLSAFHDLVAISGSLILGLAVTHRKLDVDTAWASSRIDEDWQISQWGEDEDAAESAAHKQAAFCLAHRFYGLCG